MFRVTEIVLENERSEISTMLLHEIRATTLIFISYCTITSLRVL